MVGIFLEYGFLINAQQVLLTGRVGAYILYAKFGIDKFGQQRLDAEVCVLILQDFACCLLSLGSCFLHIAPEFNVDLIYPARFFPNVAHNPKRLQHDLLYDGVAQGVLAEVVQIVVDVVGGFPFGNLLRFRVASIYNVAGQP